MNKQEMKFWARVFENAPNMSSEVMQGWIDDPKALKEFLAGLTPTKARLTALASATVKTNSIDPHDFFKIRKGLWISDNFRDLILAEASRGVVSVPDTVIGYAGLAQGASDTEIGAEMPEGYLFEDVNGFLGSLATLIESQWGGEEGALLVNGDSNIFHVEVNGKVFSVYARRNNECEYVCLARRLDDLRWRTGLRAFSAVGSQI